MNLREKIIEAAFQLFGEKGYEKTTIAGIIEAAGASKGGFYHHFKSKEEILEVITFSYVDQVKEDYDNLLADTSIPILDKFEDSFIRLDQLKKNNLKRWPNMQKAYTFKGNHVLLQKMVRRFEEVTTNFYHQLILQGNEAGVWDAPYPKELAALWGREMLQFHHWASRVFRSKDPIESEDFKRYLAFSEQLINQQLRTTGQSVQLVTIGLNYVQSLDQFIRNEVE